jgi:hypothetical protein
MLDLHRIGSSSPAAAFPFHATGRVITTRESILELRCFHKVAAALGVRGSLRET